jgi:hypothetical protein
MSDFLARIDAETQTLQRVIDRANSHLLLTIRASNADAYDEWHRDAAQLFQKLDLPAQDRDYALGALAYWALCAHRYESPHREAAEAFWTWYEG